MYNSVNNKVSFPKLEQDILEFWRENNIFEKSLTLSEKEHIFYDGPPFPTGNPHHGTIFVSILKDSIARFFTMKGYSVPRRWGWDCHGLPIENAIEKKLGIQNKSEIAESVGIDKFNQECREFVSSANDAWETYINKIGRWTHYDNAYRTMDTSYMESVLWVFKECHSKGYIYKDYRVTPYCYQCETSLSISDTRESDSTRPRTDPTVVVKLKTEKTVQDKPAFLLAWTTTPWTLISNLALAVGNEFDYVAVEHEGEALIMAEALLPKYQKVLGKNPNILQKFKGSELVDWEYQPLFPYFAGKKDKNYFRVIHSDHVTLTDGVGIVHMAPAFGEEDYWVCKQNSISVENPVDAKGCFTDEIIEFKGRNVHEANKDIIRTLKDNGVVLKQDQLEHNYPHCWRCRTPLIYRAMDAWYFAVEKIKDRLVETNEPVNWVPANVKSGRFGNWLAGARDWNISRSRFWGTPIPVWECDSEKCDFREVLGSIAEIKEKTGVLVDDLHKDFLDPLTYSCEKCDGTMVRIPEVLDCWFESGSMPYGQCHYPFENKDWFESHFPCDFIVEYPGQIRCWFYYMHVLATALFDKPAFKNCVVHGTLLAEDGSKISKSKKNYTDPMELVDSFGADALRVYLLSSPAAAMGDMSFRDQGIKDQIKDVLLPLWNAYSFFVTYGNIDHFKGDPNKVPTGEYQMDAWILARLYECEREVYDAFSNYHLNRTLNPILEFIESLTNWYIRQSRERFWQKGMPGDKLSGYETLYYILNSMVKMLAPSAPFVAESIYKNLTGNESVHLASWPRIPEKFANPELTRKIEMTRLITNLGLSLRQKLKIKVRQPLKKAMIALPKEMNQAALTDQFDVLKAELNVKDLEFIADPSQIGIIRAVPNARVLGKQFGKDMQKIIRGAREGNVAEEGDEVVVTCEGESWRISRDDIAIGYEGKEGLDVASQNGVLVTIDPAITDELREEGVANDLNRQIQNMRKDAGYEISDRIHLQLDGTIDQKWKDYLFEAALADEAKLDEQAADVQKNIELEGRQFSISMKINR